jgi:hypothetical protein
LDCGPVEGAAEHPELGPAEKRKTVWFRRMICESFSRRFSKGLQLVILQRGGLVKRSRFRRQLHIDRFPIGFVGEFEVRFVTPVRVCGAGATGFAALHHPLQHRPFAEVLDLIEPPFEFVEALRVALQ